MKLEPGEVICPECNNSGFCFRCAGTGKIDWVELCMKRNRTLIWGQKTLSMTLPLIRQMYPKSIAKDLVSVQPINWGEKDET